MPHDPASPFPVGSQAQLFTDGVLIRETDRVWLTPHAAEKHPANPLLRPDREWEGGSAGDYLNVL
jgi:hypothetical protein